MRAKTISLILPLFLLSIQALSALPLIYWENPVPFVEGRARFPQSAHSDELSVIAWQEAVQRGEELEVYLSLAVRSGAGPWQNRRRVAGPWTHGLAEPSLYSLALDGNGRILLAVAAGSGLTELYFSDDKAASFERVRLEGGGASALSPRISVAADGSYLIFQTRGSDQSLSVYYSRSYDARSWTPFASFVESEELRLNLLPVHSAHDGLDYVVWQSMSTALRPTFQLWCKVSSDGGESWSSPVQLTSFDDPETNTRPESEFWDNQRASLFSLGNELWISWERRLGNASPQVYAGVLELDTESTLTLRTPSRVSPSGVYANNPQVFSLDGEPTVLWFDNRSAQSRVYMAQRDALGWQDVLLSGSRADASFARPIPASDGLMVFWQAPLRGVDRLYILAPDRSVQQPVLRPVNFSNGGRSRRDTVRLQWDRIDDPSGIEGWSWAWSQDPDLVPAETVSLLSETTSIDLTAREDGPWYFALRARDWAGNWSRPARVSYIRDTTPPGRPAINQAPLDDAGYLLSNTFTLSWEPPDDDDVVSYSWELQYLAPMRDAAALPLDTGPVAADPSDESVWTVSEFQTIARSRWGRPFPQARPLGPGLSASFTNRDNGLWRFVVTAIDEVGNTGAYDEYYFRLNKFRPYTYISTALSSVDDQGQLSLQVLGRGYSEGGRVTKLWLDRDGKPPYDREFLLEDGGFFIRSDRELGGIRAEDLDEGMYRIGIFHPERGSYWSRPLIQVDETGTIKFGDYSRSWESVWERPQLRKYRVELSWLFAIAFIAFLAVGFFVSIRGIGSVLHEGALVRSEVSALLTGDSMPSAKRERARSLKKRSVGLRLKLAGFTTLLAAMVVAMVSIPLSIMMTRTQEATLISGLRDRAQVLLEALASGARAYLPSENLLELGFLPAQTSAVPEVLYTTISGFGSGATVFSDHIWATNDPGIADKIDTAEFQAGISRLEDPLSPRLEEIAQSLDERARSAVGELSVAIAELNREGMRIATLQDAESRQRLVDIQDTTRTLESRLNEVLSALSAETGSEPAFPQDRLDPHNDRYILYKPIMYRQGEGDIFFRGLVRLEISTASIGDELVMARQALLRITLLIALLALVIGFIGAQVLSFVIISPIKKLARHVATIRDTENKADLDGKDISIRTRDEIATLGDTINEMTQGLVKAAQASQDLTIGKEVQKMFIPLDTDSQGRKLTSGLSDTKFARFFGYYEGAKGVSGDYFDYLPLEGNYYAIIKCDVAGKGVPAALIMVEVATLFLNFFKNWKPNREGLKIETVVYQINDFIETRGFKGRFAAFTLCLFNAETGLVRFCNAGDNLVHWFDASEGIMKKLTLPETPTAGVFPNMLIEMKGGYQVQTMQLDHGDMLLLYTDGIEEAKRRFRDAKLREFLCAEGDAPVDTPHGSHAVGQADEELGFDRVRDILNAVLNRREYILKKYHAPDPSEVLRFDFSRSKGDIEDAIMALVSVEKIFRMYKVPGASEDDRVLVDRKVDGCLHEWFDQYRSYCAMHRDHPELEEYLYYTGIREDEQYDDLTILGIKRK